MKNIERNISVFDAVCDCIPGVSTITNGAQLVYRLAHKVNKTAKPINSTNSSWKDDVKVHMVSKDTFLSKAALIPFIGNFLSILYYMIEGVKSNHLEDLLPMNEPDLVEKYLSRHPLNNEEKAKKILYSSVAESNTEIFKLILDSRDWEVDSIIYALPWFSFEGYPEENVNLLLNYYDKSFSKAPNSRFNSTLFETAGSFKKAVKSNKPEIANRILNISTKCDFCSFSKFLLGHSVITESYEKGTLTPAQIENILGKLNPINLEEITKYCRQVCFEKQMLTRSIDFYDRIEAEDKVQAKKKILSDFNQVQLGIIKELLSKAIAVKDSSKLVSAFSTLVYYEATDIMDLFIEKYGDQLTRENKIAIIKKTRTSIFPNDSKLKGLENFLNTYKDDIKEEDLIKILKNYAQDVWSNNTDIIEKIIEIFPDLLENHKNEIKVIRELEIRKQNLSNGKEIIDFIEEQKEPS